MEELINSIEESIKIKNWYGVLVTALTLPDIAGKIDYPSDNSSQRRYSKWFDTYVKKFYTVNRQNGSEETFLSGRDCYALRCSFLHEGGSCISHQRARDILSDYIFIVPKNGNIYHNNLSDDVLQLQIDCFANDIIKGIKEWLGVIERDQLKKQKLQSFLKFFTY